MAQNPWDNDPVIETRSRSAALPAGQTVQEGRGGRNDTALLNQGYRPTEDGAWRRDLTEEELRAQGYVPDETGTQWVKAEVAPWEQDTQIAPLTESQKLAEVAAAERMEGINRSGQAVYSGLMLSFNDELSGNIAGFGQQVSNAVRSATGQPVLIESGDLRNAVTNRIRQEGRDFAQEKPVENFGLTAFGGGLTGGAGLARGTVAGAVGTGAAYGAGYGFGSGEGGFAERLPGAVGGAVVGGLTGGALQGAGNAASPYVQRLGGIVGRIRPRGPAAEQVAAQRLTQTIDPAAATAERARLQALGVEPSLADVTGGTTERLIRSAAGPAGPGSELAVANQLTRQAALKPEVMTATQALSPEQRTAAELAEGLTTNRSQMARRDYPAAYATPVTAGEEVLSALSDEPGRAALRRARQAAVARQDMQQITEIDQLLQGQGGEVSAGTLDSVRRAMAGRAQAMNQRPDTRDIASGLFGRASQIDEALDGVPELAPARQAYREASGAIEAVEAPLNVFNTEPRRFADWVRGLTPEQREAATVGIRQTILDQLGRQRNAGTGTLDNIAQAPYARQNLSALLGDEAAGQYIASVQARVQQAQRAARVSPNTGSQTMLRAQDEGVNPVELVSAALDGVQSLGNPMAAARTAGRVQNMQARLTMSPEVREAIVTLGLGSADDLERVIALAQSARQTGRPPPREVRAYLVRTRNVLGAQSPVTQRLEQLLLPSNLAAQEQGSE